MAWFVVPFPTGQSSALAIGVETAKTAEIVTSEHRRAPGARPLCKHIDRVEFISESPLINSWIAPPLSLISAVAWTAESEHCPNTESTASMTDVNKKVAVLYNSRKKPISHR